MSDNDINIFNFNCPKDDILKRKIVFHNKIVEARYKETLSLKDQRVLSFILSTLNDLDKNELKDLNKRFFLKIRIPKNLLVEEKNYDDLRRALHSLMSKSIVELFSEEKKKFTAYTWFTYASYEDGKDYVEVEINPSLLPYLVALSNNYTKIYVRPIYSFSCQYSMKLYMMLSRFSDTGWFTVSLFELRKQLGVEDNKYKRLYDFERYVLRPSVNDINEYTDLLVSYEKISASRKVTQIKFNISAKTSCNKSQTLTLEASYNSLKDNQELKELMLKYFGTKKHIKNPVGLWKTMTDNDIIENIRNRIIEIHSIDKELAKKAEVILTVDPVAAFACTFINFDRDLVNILERYQIVQKIYNLLSFVADMLIERVSDIDIKSEILHRNIHQELVYIIYGSINQAIEENIVYMEEANRKSKNRCISLKINPDDKEKFLEILQKNIVEFFEE
ncbi:RepB family plasmid replication initiator protein [Hydrogenobaculum acidophilum]